MTRQRIYVVQFGTGASINLLPLAAGQLYSRLLVDEVIPNAFDLPEIIFRRPRNPAEFASQLQDVAVIGFPVFSGMSRPVSRRHGPCASGSRTR